MKYQAGKERARARANEWQAGWSEHEYSYMELAQWQAYFEKLARRYGLVREFKENAII